MNQALPEASVGHPEPPPIAQEPRLDGRQVGMIAFLVSETAFFATLLLAYVIFLGPSATGPTPAEALSLPLVIATTICLLSSSFTIHRAEQELHRGHPGQFQAWWTATIILGAFFLLGTAYEWYELIWHHQLTMSRNLFGTTFFTLVGFHAAHVTVGLGLLILMLGLVRSGRIVGPAPIGVQLVSWYWHFVDCVWVVVFGIVYLFGR